MSDSQIIPPDPPGSQRTDPLLETLLKQSRQVIAEERGFTHKSRLKIQAIGEQLSASEEVVNQVLQILHGAPPISGQQNSAMELAFAKSIRRKLIELPGHILTGKIEERAIGIGVRKYELSEGVAKNIVRRVADEENVHRVTLSEAERHIEQEIAETVGEATWIRSDRKKRLIKNGGRLGVAQDQVAEMIDRYLKFNFQQEQFERRFTDRLWILAFGLVVGTCFSLFVFYQMKDGQSGASETPEKKVDNNPANGEPAKSDTPEWWTENLKLGLVKTRLNVNGFAEANDTFKSRAPERRAVGYEKIFTLFRGQEKRKLIQIRLTKIVSELARLEPDDQAFKGMLNGFEKTLRIPQAELPESEEFIGSAFWALECLHSILQDEALAPDKLGKIQGLLADCSGQPFNLYLPEKVRLEEQKSSLLRQYAKQLIDLAASFPKSGPVFFEGILDYVSSDDDEDVWQSLRFRYVKEFIRFEPDQWSLCSGMISDTIRNADIDQMIYFVNQMEMSSVEPYAAFLQQKLIENSGISNDSENVKKTAERLREYYAIDESSGESDAESKKVLNQAIENFVARWKSQPTDVPAKQLAQIWAESAYLVSLKSAFLRGLEDEFLDLVDMGVPKLDSPGWMEKLGGEAKVKLPSSKQSKTNPNPAVPNYLMQRLDTAIKKIGQYRQLRPENRIALVKAIAEMAPQIPEPEMKKLNMLAGYLIAGKSRQEHEFVMTQLEGLNEWLGLSIAFADQLQNDDASKAYALDISKSLLEIEGTLDVEAWQHELYELLMKSALNKLEIQFDLGKNEAMQTHLVLGETLQFYYQRQSEYLGVPIPKDDNLERFFVKTSRQLLASKRLVFPAGIRQKAETQLRIQPLLEEDPITRIIRRSLIARELLDWASQGDRIATNDPDEGIPGEEKPGPILTEQSSSRLKSFIQTHGRKYPTVFGQAIESELSFLSK